MIVDGYAASGQKITSADKVKVEGLVAQAQGYNDRVRQIDDNVAFRAAVEADYGKLNSEGTKPMTTETKTSSLSDAVMGAGFHYKHMPNVKVSAVDALGGKANVFPAVGEWGRSEPVTVAMGQDTRFL